MWDVRKVKCYSGENTAREIGGGQSVEDKDGGWFPFKQGGQRAWHREGLKVVS